jgi:hypothetical protein
MHGPLFLDAWIRDFRYAVRSVRKDLRFTRVAVFAQVSNRRGCG